MTCNSKKDIVLAQASYHSSTLSTSNQFTGYRVPPGPGFNGQLIGKGIEIRLYYMTSVEWVEDGVEGPGLYQKGCGLNLQGGMATLCTCKRAMLNTLHKHWQDYHSQYSVYIAALVGGQRVPKSNGRTGLVFLGRVSRSFDSFEELWNNLPEDVRNYKNVLANSKGDVYPPEIEKTFNKYREVIEEYIAAKRKKSEVTTPVVITDLNARLQNHTHRGNEEYLEDLKCAKPILFDEWRAWPDGNAYIQSDQIPGNVNKKKLERFLSRGKPAPYGIIFYLSENSGLRFLMKGMI